MTFDDVKIRDYIAIQAIVGAVALSLHDCTHGFELESEQIAKDCYEIADAMIKEGNISSAISFGVEQAILRDIGES